MARTAILINYIARYSQAIDLGTESLI